MCKNTRLCLLNGSSADTLTGSSRRFYRTLRTDNITYRSGASTELDLPAEFMPTQRPYHVSRVTLTMEILFTIRDWQALLLLREFWGMFFANLVAENA